MSFFGKSKVELEGYCSVEQTHSLYVKFFQDEKYFLSLPVFVQTWRPDDLSHLFSIRVNYSLFSENGHVSHMGFHSLAEEHYNIGVRRLGYTFFERKKLFDIVVEKTSQLQSSGEILAMVACYEDFLFAQKYPYDNHDEKIVDIRGASSYLKRY